MTDTSDYKWLIGLLVASPILLVVLIVFGVLQLGVIMATFMNYWLWLIVAFVVFIVNVEKWVLWGVLIGFGYWIFSVVSVLMKASWLCNIPIFGSAVCGGYTIIRLFDLVGTILATIIMVGVFKLIREELER